MKKIAVCLIILIMLMGTGIFRATEVMADETPSILFLGTLCDARGLDPGKIDEESGEMSADSIRTMLDTLSESADVTYYLFSGTEEDSGAQIAGNLKRGETITKNFEYKKDCHRALAAYLNIIDDELVIQKNEYDFIVLLFDSARLAVGYNNENEYLENAVSGVMYNYYENGRVIWLTDEKNLFEPEYDYANNNANNYYDQGSTDNGYLGKSAFKGLSALISPSDYLKWKEKFPQYLSNTLYELTGVQENAKTSYKGDFVTFIKDRIGRKPEELRTEAVEFLTEAESIIETTEELVTAVEEAQAVLEAEQVFEMPVLAETEEEAPEVVYEAPEEFEEVIVTEAEEPPVTGPDTSDSSHILLYILLCTVAVLLISLNTSVLLNKRN